MRATCLFDVLRHSLRVSLALTVLLLLAALLCR
jgi:hypothetical protein